MTIAQYIQIGDIVTLCEEDPSIGHYSAHRDPEHNRQAVAPIGVLPRLCACSSCYRYYAVAMTLVTEAIATWTRWSVTMTSTLVSRG